jgi:flagellar basal body-associated protein FliL
MSSAEEAKPAAKKSGLPIPLLVVAINSLVALAAVGMLVYTKLLFKRPPITESQERKRIEESRKAIAPALKSALISFEPLTANIKNTEEHGKLHYATIGFALEIRDELKKDVIEGLKPRIVDSVLSMMGRKPFQELTSVQGRYLFRTQIIDTVNAMSAKKPEGAAGEAAPAQPAAEHAAVPDGLVTNVFFTQFTVQ